jgi:hypothetical protein
LASLERWSPTLFLVAGALGLVYTALWGLVAFVGVEYPILRDVVFRVQSYVVGSVALLGLYPSLADGRPKLARGGGVFAALAVVGLLVDGLVGASRSLAVYLGAEPPAWIAAFGLLILLGFVVGFPAFGVASLRTGVHSRIAGLALLTPVFVTAMNLGIVAAGLTSPTARFLVSGGYALAHLAIGVAIRTGSVTANRTDTRPAEV